MKNLYKKILETRKLIKSVQKTKGTGEKFKTVKSESVMGEIREAINQTGLLFIPSIISKQQSILPTWIDNYKKEHTEIQVDLEMEYKIIDADSGESFVAKWHAMGQDDREIAKAQGKALTYAEKYFFLKFFQISTNDDDPDYGKNINNYEGSLKTPKELGVSGVDCVSGVDKITEGQAKRFYAIYKNTGKTDEEVLNYLKTTYKVEHSRDINKGDYDKLCEWAELK